MSNADEFKKILIYRIGHIGDTIVSLPALWAIRKRFPNAEITLLTNENSRHSKFVMAKSILPEHSLIDRWMFYPSSLSRIETAFVRFKLFVSLRLKNFDALFYLMPRTRAASSIERDKKFFKLCGVRNIYGADYLAANRLDEYGAKNFPEVEQEGEFFLKCLPNDEFLFDLDSTPDLDLKETEKEFAENWLAEVCGNDFRDKKLIAIAPGSKWESKIWAEERFEKVVGELIEKYDVFPVIFGGEEDRIKGERLLEKWKRGANAAGKLNIRQAAAGLAHCKFYVGNDTGTMHLAAAVGTPCVGIFAAIDYAGRWNPFGNNHIILRERVECEGCHSETCPYENLCLDKISAERVFNACEKLLLETN